MLRKMRLKISIEDDKNMTGDKVKPSVDLADGFTMLLIGIRCSY